MSQPMPKERRIVQIIPATGWVLASMSIECDESPTGFTPVAFFALDEDGYVTPWTAGRSAAEDYALFSAPVDDNPIHSEDCWMEMLVYMPGYSDSPALIDRTKHGFNARAKREAGEEKE